MQRLVAKPLLRPGRVAVWNYYNRHLSTTASRLSSKHNNAFTFLPSNVLPAKPRSYGLTEIRGPYYTPVTQTYLDELLTDWGEYVDGVKFAAGSFTLMPQERIRAFIDAAHKHGIKAFRSIIV